MGRVYKTWGNTTVSFTRTSTPSSKTATRTWGGTTVSKTNNQQETINQQLEAESPAQKTTTQEIKPTSTTVTAQAQTIQPRDSKLYRDAGIIPAPTIEEQFPRRRTLTTSSNLPMSTANTYVTRQSLVNKRISKEGVKETPLSVYPSKNGLVFVEDYPNRKVIRTYTVTSTEKRDIVGFMKGGELVRKPTLKEFLFTTPAQVRADTILETGGELKETPSNKLDRFINVQTEKVVNKLPVSQGTKDVLLYRLPFRFSNIAKFSFFSPAFATTVQGQQSLINQGVIKPETRTYSFSQQYPQSNTKYPTTKSENIDFGKIAGKETFGKSQTVTITNKGTSFQVTKGQTSYYSKGNQITDYYAGSSAVQASKTTTIGNTRITDVKIYSTATKYATKTGYNLNTYPTYSGTQAVSSEVIKGTVIQEGSKGTLIGTTKGNLIPNVINKFQINTAPAGTSIGSSGLGTQTTSFLKQIGTTTAGLQTSAIQPVTQSSGVGLISGVGVSGSTKSLSPSVSRTISRIDVKTETYQKGYPTLQGTSLKTLQDIYYKPMVSQTTAPITKSSSRSGSSGQVQIIKPIQDQDQGTGQSNIVKNITISGIAIGGRTITSFGGKKIKGYIPPVNLNFTDVGRYGRFKGGSAQVGYSPSFNALLFNIKGTKPTGVETGVSFRPITPNFSFFKKKKLIRIRGF